MKNLQSYCVKENQTVKEAISIIQGNLSRCVMVLSEKNKVVGAFSEGDALRTILQDIDIHSSLKKVINPSFRYLNNKDLTEAYELIKKYGITLIPVIDSDFNLKDIITIYDVLEQLDFNRR